MSLLTLNNVEASYGPAQALFDVSLSVGEGEVVALMGRNGMGKTTTVRTILRMLRHHGGSIAFAGHNLAQLPSHRVAQLGIGLVPEGRRCFADLSVRENLVAAARSGLWDEATVGRLFPRLAERRDQRAGTLSGGEQQMLAIGRALMTNPRLLILDEATEGLAPVVRAEIWRAIDSLKRTSGLAILVIDKTVPELARIADRAVVLERGRTVWKGAFGDFNADMQARWLGI